MSSLEPVRSHGADQRVLTSGDEHLIAWDNLITSIINGTCGTPTVDGNVVSFHEEMCLKIKQNTAEDILTA